MQMPARFTLHLFDHDSGGPNIDLTWEVRDGVPECADVHITRRRRHEIRVSGRPTHPKAAEAGGPESITWTAARTFLEGTRSSRHWRAYLVLATTGLRRGQALGLRWSDL
jgi:hypothetical protein